MGATARICESRATLQRTSGEFDSRRPIRAALLPGKSSPGIIPVREKKKNKIREVCSLGAAEARLAAWNSRQRLFGHGVIAGEGLPGPEELGRPGCGRGAPVFVGRRQAEGEKSRAAEVQAAGGDVGLR